MKNAFVIGTLGLVLSFAMLAFGFVAGRAPADVPEIASRATADSPAMARANIESIVREYLISNPEVLLEVQAAYEERQREEERIAQLGIIETARPEIFNASYDGVVGNPNGKTTVVEFYDYNCGYCKRAITDMQEMVKADPDLRFVLKEFPILGADSQKAHIVSMAFRALMPEKFEEFHDRLLGGMEHAGEDTAVRLAVSLGADEQALRREMQNPAIEAAFNKTYELAQQLRITGTPSYVIGNEVVFGAIGRETLTAKVKAARAACTSAAC